MTLGANAIYTLVLDIPIYRDAPGRVAMPRGLARDLAAHLRHEPGLRLLCPSAASRGVVKDPVEVETDGPGRLSVGLLPCDGTRRGWPGQRGAVAQVLRDEARQSDVWHTGVSLGLVDLSSLAFAVGRSHAAGARVVCLDSDPAAMLTMGGGVGRFKAALVRRALRRRAADADGVIFVGTGAAEVYRPYAKRSVITNAVWLNDGDVASPEQAAPRFSELADPDTEPRLVVPTRLTAWKGVDDVLHATAKLADTGVSRFRVDVVGAGDQLEPLKAQAQRLQLGDRCRFREPVPYGRPFFDLLAEYHMVLVPTRAAEEARIVYDAMAAGCVLMHSATHTLESALADQPDRWTHEPGSVDGIAETLRRALGECGRWGEASRAGIAFVSRRTIDGMHRQRAAFIDEVRRATRRPGPSDTNTRTDAPGPPAGALPHDLPRAER